MRNIKHQVIDISFGEGSATGIATAAGDITKINVRTDGAYPIGTGIRVIPIEVSSSPDYKIGISDENGTVHNRTHNSDWVFDASCPVTQRTKPVYFKAGGGNVEIYVETEAALTGAEYLQIQIILELEKEPAQA